MVPHQRLSWLATDYCGLFQPARATGQCMVQSSKPALEDPRWVPLPGGGFIKRRMTCVGVQACHHLDKEEGWLGN